MAASPCNGTSAATNPFLEGVSLNRGPSWSLAFRLHSFWREQFPCPFAQAPLLASQRPCMTADPRTVPTLG